VASFLGSPGRLTFATEPIMSNCANADNALNNLLTSGGIQSITTEAGSVTNRPVANLVQLHSYLSGICAANNPKLGVRYTRLIPDGTVHLRRGATGSFGWRGF
jgi:hypothetical protein